MKTSRAPRVIALIAYLFMVGMNVAATALPLNGQSTNEISDRYDTLFAPIGFTFAIWGVIYLLLGVYSIYQLGRDSEMIRVITPWFIASSVLNGVWIIAWHYEVLWLSVLIIIGLLVTLIRINLVTTVRRLGWGTSSAIVLPFAVYFGWVSVATVANVSATLVQFGWRGGWLFNEQGWTLAILIVATAIGVLAMIGTSSPAYGLVFVWAFWGIYSRHLASDEWAGQYPVIIQTLQVLLPLLAISVVVAAVRWLRLTPEISPQDS